MGDLAVLVNRLPLVFTLFVCVSMALPLTGRLLWLPDDARGLGIHIQASKGSGKSRLLGRIIGFQDFLRGMPLAIYDPLGTTIDNLLDRLILLPREYQERLWQRIVYVDMSGRCGYVFPFPLFYRLASESLFDVSQRFLDVVRKLDPFLQTASIEGWNALWRTGTATGMILSALNLQITEAESLLTDPLAWRGRLARAKHAYPDVAPAVDYFDEFMNLKEETQIRRSESFRNKIALFNFSDAPTRAIFGANKPAIDWNHVIKNRLAVLFDFRGVVDTEERRFKMAWTFNHLLTFIKHRGAGRHRPISVIIDELASIFSPQMLNSDVFAAELDDLINVWARNCRVFLTLSNQEAFQMNEHAQKTLMAMGTQVLGPVSDRGDAMSLAKQFIPFDPYLVKKREPMYMSSHGFAYIIDYRTIEFSDQEQLILNSYRFSNQGKFHFLVRPARAEGDTRGRLIPITLANFDRNQYPNEQLVAQARQLLMERRGRRVDEAMAEIEGRQSALVELPTRIRGRIEKKISLPREPSGTIVDYEPVDDLDDPREFGEKKTAFRHKKGRTE